MFGDVDVRTSGGNLAIDGVDGCVDARLSGGTTSIVFLGDPKGEIRSSGGTIDVRLHEDANFDLDAKSNGGTLKVDVELDREWSTTRTASTAAAAGAARASSSARTAATSRSG